MPMKKPIFIFDLGNVLVNFSEKELITIIAEESGLPYEEIWDNRIDDDLIAVETGKLSPKEYFEKSVRRKIPHWKYDDLIQLWIDVFFLNPDGRGLFLNLKKKGYDVYILSNLAEFNKIAVERKFPGFFKESTENIFSYKLGFHKPDPRIYRTVTERVRVRPEDCVFFDDAYKNVEGARQAGWMGIHFCKDNFPEIECIVNSITEGI